MGGANGGKFRGDERGIDYVGSFAKQTQQDGTVGAVADAGEGERSVEFDVDGVCMREQVCRAECLDEAQGGAHGTDGV